MLYNDASKITIQTRDHKNFLEKRHIPNNSDKFSKRYKISIIPRWSKVLHSCKPLIKNVQACRPEQARNSSKSWCSLKKGLYQESGAEMLENFPVR